MQATGKFAIPLSRTVFENGQHWVITGKDEGDFDDGAQARISNVKFAPPLAPTEIADPRETSSAIKTFRSSAESFLDVNLAISDPVAAARPSTPLSWGSALKTNLYGGMPITTVLSVVALLDSRKIELDPVLQHFLVASSALLSIGLLVHCAPRHPATGAEEQLPEAGMLRSLLKRCGVPADAIRQFFMDWKVEFSLTPLGLNLITSRHQPFTDWQKDLPLRFFPALNCALTMFIGTVILKMCAGVSAPEPGPRLDDSKAQYGSTHRIEIASSSSARQVEAPVQPEPKGDASELPITRRLPQSAIGNITKLYAPPFLALFCATAPFSYESDDVSIEARVALANTMLMGLGFMGTTISKLVVTPIVDKAHVAAQALCPRLFVSE